jgi:hypothetical protein
MRNQFTKEQKAAYFKSLRNRWQEVKKMAGQDEARAIIQEMGLKISVYGYMFVKRQMIELGLDGTPYIDCKTFQGWKAAGFMVKKGEKSQISGITWIACGEEKEIEQSGADVDVYLFPKEYHLFHKTQVEEL